MASPFLQTPRQETLPFPLHAFRRVVPNTPNLLVRPRGAFGCDGGMSSVDCWLQRGVWRVRTWHSELSALLAADQGPHVRGPDAWPRWHTAGLTAVRVVLLGALLYSFYQCYSIVSIFLKEINSGNSRARTFVQIDGNCLQVTRLGSLGLGPVSSSCAGEERSPVCSSAPDPGLLSPETWVPCGLTLWWPRCLFGKCCVTAWGHHSDIF